MKLAAIILFSLKKEDYNQNRERTNYTIFAIPLTKLCPFK